MVDLITDSEVGVSARINGDERDRRGAAQGGRTERSGAAVPAGQHRGQSRRKRRHLGDGGEPRRLAVSARDPDRPGELGRRRKRVQVGQRASAGRPAQPQRRAGAHLHAGQQAGAAEQSQSSLPSAGQGSDARREGQPRTARPRRGPADEPRRVSPAHADRGARRWSSCSSRSASSRRSPCSASTVDLSPLLVAFVGLLCGSTIGAATGFAVGLLVDLALVQTLGLTSLVLHARRLLVRASARAARPPGGADAAARRRRAPRPRRSSATR